MMKSILTVLQLLEHLWHDMRQEQVARAATEEARAVAIACYFHFICF